MLTSSVTRPLLKPFPRWSSARPNARKASLWLGEAAVCGVAKDDLLLFREACQGRTEHYEVTFDDSYITSAMVLFEENGKFREAKVKRMEGLWTSFLTWVSNYDPVAVRNLLTRWKERPTEEGLLAAFERTFGSPFDRKTRQFLAFDWEVSETT